jgi:predicted amidohydrolase YtcJ
MAARITAYVVACIVSVTFIAGLIVGANRDDAGPVDLIVVNGNVYTADRESTRAEAVAVQGNKILMVGSNREIQRLRRPQTVVVDARGGTVLPGFNDSSLEFLESSLLLQQVNLIDADTTLAIESAIKGWAAANPDKPWVLGHGWTLEAFDDGGPTRQRLDALVPDRPAFLIARDGESAWVNTAALKLAKITGRTPNPVDGVIVKEPRSGEPSGILKDAAIDLVEQVLPGPSRDDRLAALRAAIDEAHRRGVTSVQDIGADVADLELYDSMRRNQELDVRIYAAIRGRSDMSESELEALDAVRKKYADDPVFKTGAITLVAEEADAERLGAIVTALDERGWQIIIQAIGDTAVRLAKDAVEYASRTSPERDRDRRHRVDETEEAFAQPGVHLAVTEKTTLAQAIDAITRDAAWSSFDEHRKGTLERDMLADIVILTTDIFAAPAGRAPDADVAVTIFDGRVVYTRSTDSND